jgi:hypothetical protein
MPLHPLFQDIVDAHVRPRPYRLYDDAQWPELPGATVETDDSGRASIMHDPADERERLHRPGNPFR